MDEIVNAQEYRDYMDKAAIRILECNKVEDALELANEIVSDAKCGAERNIRVEAQGSNLYREIPNLVAVIGRSIPLHVEGLTSSHKAW